MVHNNLTFYFSVCYFIFYSSVIINFCIIFRAQLKTTTNIYALFPFLEYSKQKLYLFLISIFAALGVPPCSLFIPKFAGLTAVYYNSTWIVFIYTLLITFLSFTLYLQLFDGLFKKKRNHFLRNYFTLKIKQKKTHKNFLAKNAEFHFLILTFSSILFFKDIFNILYVFC